MLNAVKAKQRLDEIKSFGKLLSYSYVVKNKRLHIYNEKSYYCGKDEKELIKKYGEGSYMNSLDEYMF